MNTVRWVGVLLLFPLVVFGSAWYIAFRLRTTFGLSRHARGQAGVSFHAWPVSPGSSTGLRVARGRNVHVSRSTRHLKRTERSAAEADKRAPQARCHPPEGAGDHPRGPSDYSKLSFSNKAR